MSEIELLYDVRSAITGAVVVSGVDQDTARNECARLNAEAKVINPETRRPTGMERGKTTRYEVVSRGGITVGA